MKRSRKRLKRLRSLTGSSLVDSLRGNSLPLDGIPPWVAAGDVVNQPGNGGLETIRPGRWMLYLRRTLPSQRDHPAIWRLPLIVSI